MTEQHELLKKYLYEISVENAPSMKIEENASLAKASSFAIGGVADIACYPRSADELVCVIRTAKKADIPFFIAGNATNLLFDDDGYAGLIVFTTEMNGISVDGNIITVYAGAALTELCDIACSESLSGLEFAYGIPGTVGGAVYMNCGAFGGEISQILRKSTYYDPDTNEIVTINSDEHDFSYRHSFYMCSNKIILSAEFELISGNSRDIRAAMDDHMSHRIKNQPLDYPSAGSIFKRYNGYHISRLIEEAGLKGVTVGKACVSTKHAGFIVNLGGATAADVLELVDIIKEKIFGSHGIHIECEVIFVPSGR